MEQLIQYFQHKGMKQEEALRITGYFSKREMAKGDYFVQEGKIGRYMAFAVSGVFRYYYLKDGQDITTYASGPGSFLLSLASFFRQQPSLENICALTDASIWQLSYTDVQSLKKKDPAFLQFYIQALEHLTVGMDETRTNLIMLTAEERYALLMKNEPNLLQQVPLQYLASILGVTPRHLGRIRQQYTAT